MLKREYIFEHCKEFDLKWHQELYGSKVMPETLKFATIYHARASSAMTSYSALASGRLAKHPGEESKRLSEDIYEKGKYDITHDEDLAIIHRVEELAEKKGLSMTEISLAWLLTKVTSPIIGATKPHHIDGAVKAVTVKLTDEEIIYLEELYKPHRLVGVMAENK